MQNTLCKRRRIKRKEYEPKNKSKKVPTHSDSALLPFFLVLAVTSVTASTSIESLLFFFLLLAESTSMAGDLTKDLDSCPSKVSRGVSTSWSTRASRTSTSPHDVRFLGKKIYFYFLISIHKLFVPLDNMEHVYTYI